MFKDTADKMRTKKKLHITVVIEVDALDIEQTNLELFEPLFGEYEAVITDMKTVDVKTR